MRSLIAVVATWVFIVAAAPALAQSVQAPSTDRRFEVASVKPSLSPLELGRLAAQGGGPAQMPRTGIQTRPGGRFTARSSLKQLIAEAFDVKDYQIEGGPEWLATDYFEITANAGADATPADVKVMLRSLLAERFRLRTRGETRQAPVYLLTIARSDGRLGSRLTRTSPECAQQTEQRQAARTSAVTAPPPASDADRQKELAALKDMMRRATSGDAAVTARCGTTMMGSRANGVSTYSFGGMELTSLVSRLSSELSAPVIDRTELTGLFDIALEYWSERSINGRPAGLDPNSTEPLPPPLTGALQQQLGLKIEKQIGPMPVVVIDAAAQPTPD